MLIQYRFNLPKNKVIPILVDFKSAFFSVNSYLAEWPCHSLKLDERYKTYTEIST